MYILPKLTPVLLQAAHATLWVSISDLAIAFPEEEYHIAATLLCSYVTHVKVI